MRCNLCSLVFVSINNFIQHLKIAHPNEPLYVCIYKKCPRTFFTTSQLEGHIESCVFSSNMNDFN